MRMHGGLLCITFCMSGWMDGWMDGWMCMYVCHWTNIETRQKVIRQKVTSQEILHVKGHVGHGQSKAYLIGRWAHFNVKLHFFFQN